MPRSWRKAIVATTLVAFMAIGLSLIAEGRFVWGAPEIPKAQCEALVTGAPLALGYRAEIATAVIREPQNTWSNLAFVFGGALVMAHDRRRLSRLLGIALIALGLASGVYHASLLPLWRTVDVAAMGWTMFALAAVGFSAIAGSRDGGGRDSTLQICLGVLGSMAAVVVAVFRNDIRIAGVKPFDSTYTTVTGVTTVSALMLAGIGLAFKSHAAIRGPLKKVAVLAAMIAVAVACQLGDHPGKCFCRPQGPLQAHAIWHLLMAGAVVLAYDIFSVLETQTSLFGRFSS